MTPHLLPAPGPHDSHPLAAIIGVVVYAILVFLLFHKRFSR